MEQVCKLVGEVSLQRILMVCWGIGLDASALHSRRDTLTRGSLIHGQFLGHLNALQWFVYVTSRSEVMSQFRPMKHILTPPFLGSLRTPWSAGLTLHWHMALFILTAYLFLLAFYLLLGQNPTDMTVSFFGESFDAISPLLENTVGYWLLISYLHAAVAPLNFELTYWLRFDLRCHERPMGRYI